MPPYRSKSNRSYFSQFHGLGFFTCQGHTRIFDLGNLNLFYKGRPRPTIRTSSQIFRGIISTILTYKCRFFLCDDKPLSISLPHTQSLDKNQSSHLAQTDVLACCGLPQSRSGSLDTWPYILENETSSLQLSHIE